MKPTILTKEYAAVENGTISNDQVVRDGMGNIIVRRYPLLHVCDETRKLNFDRLVLTRPQLRQPMRSGFCRARQSYNRS